MATRAHPPADREIMRVRTRRKFLVPPGTVWPLLCGSRMEPARGLLFRLGVPRPIECRLPQGTGGVGAERECESDQGRVRQRILLWEPESRLSFRMEFTTTPSLRSVREVVDTFELTGTGDGTMVTRTSEVRVEGGFSPWKALLTFVGIKQVHRFVFRNWRRQAPRSRGNPAAPGRLPSQVAT